MVLFAPAPCPSLQDNEACQASWARIPSPPVPSSKSGHCLGCLWVYKMELSLKAGPWERQAAVAPGTLTLTASGTPALTLQKSAARES